MKFNQHAKTLLQEANNTHLKVVQVTPGIYLIRCVLGETILQGPNAKLYGSLCEALTQKYCLESESDCRLIAFHPMLANFKNPFFNNPSLVHMTLKDLMSTTAQETEMSAS